MVHKAWRIRRLALVVLVGLACQSLVVHTAWGQVGMTNQQADANQEAAANRNNKQPATPLQSIEELITVTIAPTTWDDVGGEGSFVVMELMNMLVVSQTNEVHEQIENLLHTMTRVVAEQRGQDVAEQPLFRVRSTIAPEMVDRHDAIQAALRSETSVDFFEEPLTDVVKSLEQQFGIEIELDTLAMETIGIPMDQVVTKQVSGTKLKTVLQLILRDLGLTYAVNGEVLMITTPDGAPAHSMQTKVYWISPQLFHQTAGE